MAEKDAHLNIRINSQLKQRFLVAAEGSYQTPSDVVAMLVEAYCKEYERRQRKAAKIEKREAAE